MSIRGCPLRRTEMLKPQRKMRETLLRTNLCITSTSCSTGSARSGLHTTWSTGSRRGSRSLTLTRRSSPPSRWNAIFF
ncbi:hypothetical protein PHMEG_00035549, partial [Phytophthora megakarya]